MYYHKSKNESLDKIDKSICNTIIIMISVVFLFPYQIRIGLLGKGIGASNIVSIIALMYLIIFFGRYFGVKVKILFSFLSFYYIFSGVLFMGIGIDLIKGYIAFVLPIILIGLNLNVKNIPIMLSKVLRIFNFVIIIITLFGIVDYVTDNSIINFISQIMTESMREQIQGQQYAEIRRMYSYFGHPLFNTQLYLMFLVLNFLNNKYFDKILSNFIVLIIGAIGIALTGSKTGLVLYIISIIILYGKKISIKQYIMISIILIIVYNLGLFDNTIQRFLQGSLTSGRAEQWEVVNDLGLYPIKKFIGYGIGFTFSLNEIIPLASAAFEYPIRMFALELGLMNTILILIIIIIYPVLKLLRRRHYFLFLGYAVVLIDVNTYNGLSLIGDNMLILAVFIFLILNISNYLIYKEN